METLVVIVVGALAAALVAAGLWGSSGGMLRSQFASLRTQEEAIRRMFRPEVFAPDVVRCGWPRKYGAVPPNALAIDRKRQLLMVCEVVDGKWKAFMFRPERILRVQLLENSQTVGSVSRGAQIGGAAVGAVVAGQAGAIVGGLSSGMSSSSELTRVGLLLMLEGDQRPFTIDFCLWDRSIAQDGWFNLPPDGQRRMMAEAREWLHMIEVIMRAHESEAA